MKRGLKYIQHKSGVVQRVRIRRLTNLPTITVAHGVGSIFGEAEALQLARQGRFSEASAHGKAHNLEIPPKSRRLSGFVIDQWRATPDDSVPQRGTEHG